MAGTPVDIVVFAPLAPILGMLLFWFIQLLFIESEKYLLEKIRPKHEPLCRFTNFLGILFQNICHALGYTVTKSGISDFYISVGYGKVAPKKEKKGIFEWVSNAFLFIGPFFIPAFLLFICLVVLIPDIFSIKTPEVITSIKYTFGAQLISFGTNLYLFAERFLSFLLYEMDLLHPGHLGFLLLLIFLGMGIRPSYIGEKKIDKVDMMYDLRNIWSLITHKPLYVLILFLMSYIFFYISFYLNQNWYVALFSILGWLSIISIVAIIIAESIISLIRTTDDLPRIWKCFPFITLPVSYILARLLFYYYPNNYTISLSLIIMILSTFFVTILSLKYKTNKFKTHLNIKLSKRRDKGDK